MTGGFSRPWVPSMFDCMDQMSDTYFVGIVFEGLRSLPRPLGKSLCFKSQQQMDYAISGTGQIQKIGQLKLESHFQSGREPILRKWLPSRI
jgi:hypothetical protein